MPVAITVVTNTQGDPAISAVPSATRLKPLVIQGAYPKVATAPYRTAKLNSIDDPSARPML
jgi:hypothetical protein